MCDVSLHDGDVIDFSLFIAALIFFCVCVYLFLRCLKEGPALVYTEAGELPVRALAQRPRGEDPGGV